MSNLQDLKCVPCRGDLPPMTYEEITQRLSEIPGWTLIQQDNEYRLQRKFKVKDFSEALDYANRIGLLANQEDHHPAVLIEWGKATVTWWTHKIHGLHQNDFIMAAKTDQIFVINIRG